MRLVDTHTHLYLEQFDEDRPAVIERAVGLGIDNFYLPNVDSRTIEAMLQMEIDFPGRCYAMMGLHPCSVEDAFEKELKIVEDWLARRSFVAIGEIGIDLYWDKTHVKEQQIAFRRQANWAKSLGLPIVIHSRDSTDMLIDLVKEEQDGRLTGIFHCFTGTIEQARQIIDLGFHLGIGGVLTFKNAGLDKTLEKVDLQHLVLETDAPYLAPAPHRGKRNESAYVRLVADQLAAVKGCSIEDIARVTSRNADRIFRQVEADV
jgi:TatD DNase family protein